MSLVPVVCILRTVDKQWKLLYPWQRFSKVPPQKKQMQPILLPAFVIYIRCKFEVAVYLFFISVLCLFTMLNIKKNKIKLARPMNILRIDKPVTIGFTILA